MTLLLAVLLTASPEVNLLSPKQGTVLIESPPSYGGTWSAESLVDDNVSVGWCSAAGVMGPYTFTFELEQLSALTSVRVENAHAEEGSYRGISAAGVEVWGSQGGPFKKFATVPLQRAGHAVLQLPADTRAKQVRLVVPKNWGQTQYTELMEVAVLGHPLEPAPNVRMQGTWALGGESSLKLTQDGSTLRGCAVWADHAWDLTGAVTGRTATLDWKASDGTRGTLLTVLSDDGALHGHVNGTHWASAQPSSTALSCSEVLAEFELKQRLAAAPLGVAVELSFDASDELVMSAKDWKPLLGVLRHGARVRLVVLGRSSEPLPDELKRCERRAQSVLRHLKEAGIGATAVDLGFGVLRVGSAVQVEPRVEVTLLGP